MILFDPDQLVRVLSDGEFQSLAELRDKFLVFHFEDQLTPADKKFLGYAHITLGGDHGERVRQEKL